MLLQRFVLPVSAIYLQGAKSGKYDDGVFSVGRCVLSSAAEHHPAAGKQEMNLDGSHKTGLIYICESDPLHGLMILLVPVTEVCNL